MIEKIVGELNEDQIDMDDVLIIADGGEVMNNVQKVSSPYWPRIVHVQSIMGCEAPVVIWVACAQGKYLEAGRQVCQNKPKASLFLVNF